MRINYILNALGLVLRYLSLIILVPILVAIYYHDWNSIIPFVTASAVAFLTGLIIRNKKVDFDYLNNLKRTEGLAIVTLCWVTFALIAMIVYLFYGLSPINALFEATSGITTTGATILTNFSAFPKTMFFFRSFSQWIGGMGIIIMFIAILPQFAVAGRQMFFAEATGPVKDKITPRIKNTAITLWGVYIILTALEIICLKIAGMGLFESVCHSFSTIAAGGFSPNAASISEYSPTVSWIMIVFMFLAGTNFALQYKVFFKGQITKLLLNEEFRFYCGVIIVISAFLASALIINQHFDFVTSIRESLFQVISMLTSSGFATLDFASWNTAEKVFLFTTAMIGACAGSAAGGVKAVRVLFAFKFLKREIAKLVHPQGVFTMKLDNKVIPNEIADQILSFLVFYIVLCVVTSIIATVIESNVVVGMSGAIASLGNIGPGFADIGPMNNFNNLHTATKFVFIFNMIVGRLELVPFLIFLHPDLWKLRKQ